MRIKHTKEKWNNLPLYAIRTICIVEDIGIIIQAGKITGTEPRKGWLPLNRYADEL